ncbi:hypothetical protein DFA_10652 [Cavenderia fasciculata]|uniref:Uncharacterized protein n=1 Tax=Cavenderia fasciculata TaxID=261658 RepID=F4QB07_CACFS|nr:hypothetical protein DFA_10652 [Cavenderia fasciculata]EGG14779.1 hypothetical protein DFA_10652 [Cavenderia fasciculata]|eukprot:XP_004351295.1 hypothetical protein DFA_10652 [Cavenderia fasciculata]
MNHMRIIDSHLHDYTNYMNLN